MPRTQTVEDAPRADAVDVAAIRAVFDAQRERRRATAATTAAERVERLLRLKRAILARSGELYEALASDLRKHPAEVELTELQPALAEIKHTVAHLANWMRPRRAATPATLFGTRSEVRYEPKGVV